MTSADDRADDAPHDVAPRDDAPDDRAPDIESAPRDIEPDEKDWTWVLQRPCPDCGFDARFRH